jgi:hypothetical protein
MIKQETSTEPDPLSDCDHTVVDPTVRVGNVVRRSAENPLQLRLTALKLLLDLRE